MNNYVPVASIGSGTYGTVYYAIDEQRGIEVAVKALTIDGLTWDQTLTMNEVQILTKLPPHPNIVRLLEVVKDNGNIYLVFEYLSGGSLLHLLENNRLNALAVRNISYKMLQGLSHLHEYGVIHRDLKIDNLLFSQPYDASASVMNVKIGDFGLAKYASGPFPMTHYTTTRWYRSPEQILQYDKYTTAVDIWSAACVIAELASGRPLFPGSSEVDQMAKIVALLGAPLATRNSTDSRRSSSFVSRKSYQLVYTGLAAYLTDNSIGVTEYTLEAAVHNLKKELNCEMALADLLARMLHWDISERYTAAQALGHPYFATQLKM